MLVDIPTIGNSWVKSDFGLHTEGTYRHNFSETTLLQTHPNPVSGVYEEGLVIILSLQKVRS